MTKCNICYEEIERKELPKQMKISLGEFKDGHFVTKKSLYCHINCMV
ncbi:MAG: hypothetical protein GF311_13885 [Candidatus Lokiarchaeota archaeon]|nr:hypothetical protein [Candidatus Lokiarchaeota archaeon]